MINRENLVKIGRAGGKTSNRKTPDQIGRVGISARQICDLSPVNNKQTWLKGLTFFTRSNNLTVKFPVPGPISKTVSVDRKPA